MTLAPRDSEWVTGEPEPNAVFVGRQESPDQMTVRDALVYHVSEGATPAEAVDAVLLILDEDSTQAMAELGVRKCLHELAQTGQVAFRRRLSRARHRHKVRMVRALAQLSKRPPPDATVD